MRRKIWIVTEKTKNIARQCENIQAPLCNKLIASYQDDTFSIQEIFLKEQNTIFSIKWVLKQKCPSKLRKLYLTPSHDKQPL